MKIFSPLFTRFYSIALVFLLVFYQIPPVEADSTPTITASSAIVIEATSGNPLYQKNADVLMVPASMTKVMTAYIVFEEMYRGNLTKDTLLTVSARHASLSTNRSYPANVPMTQGQQITVEKLLQLLFLPSSSSACIMLAERISGSESAFVARMNATAEQLGVEAKYSNCHGAFVHYITARGQARLVQEFIRRFPEVLGYTP